MSFPFKLRWRLVSFPLVRPWDIALRLLRAFSRRPAGAGAPSLPWRESFAAGETVAEVASCAPPLTDFPKESLATAFSAAAEWTHLIEGDTTLAARIFGLAEPPRQPQTIAVHLEPHP